MEIQHGRRNTSWISDILSCCSAFFSDPSHILPNTASYNDLIFTCQSNSLVYCGVPLSLHSNCYHQNHQIVNWVNYMFNFKFIYSLPCECLFSDFIKVYTENIKKSIPFFNWLSIFHQEKIDEQDYIFS